MHGYKAHGIFKLFAKINKNKSEFIRIKINIYKKSQYF